MTDDTTAYIIGTGPSLRLYPLRFFNDKFTIGLNQAFRTITPTVSITIHPYLIPVDHTLWNTKWYTKHKPQDPRYQEHVNAGNYERFRLFNNKEDWNVFRITSGKTLYSGRGIQTSAIHLACVLGAKYIILVGCDCCEIDNEHHSTDQHVEFHNFLPEEVYNEYYYYTEKCRRLAKEIYDAEVFSMSPCIGLDPKRDWKQLKKFRNVSELPKPKEIEVLKRTTPLVTDYIK